MYLRLLMVCMQLYQGSRCNVCFDWVRQYSSQLYFSIAGREEFIVFIVIESSVLHLKGLFVYRSYFDILRWAIPEMHAAFLLFCD
jgi:hypothetical protein